MATSLGLFSCLDCQLHVFVGVGHFKGGPDTTELIDGWCILKHLCCRVVDGGPIPLGPEGRLVRIEWSKARNNGIEATWQALDLDVWLERSFDQLPSDDGAWQEKEDRLETICIIVTTPCQIEWQVLKVA